MEQTINLQLNGDKKNLTFTSKLKKEDWSKGEWWVSSTLHFLSLLEEREKLKEEDDGGDDEEEVKGWIFVSKIRGKR